MKGGLELARSDEDRYQASGLVVENCPEGYGGAEWLPSYPTQEEQRGVLGFENQSFQAALSNDAEIRVCHEDLSTTFRKGKQRAWAQVRSNHIPGTVGWRCDKAMALS